MAPSIPPAWLLRPEKLVRSVVGSKLAHSHLPLGIQSEMERTVFAVGEERETPRTPPCRVLWEQS